MLKSLKRIESLKDVKKPISLSKKKWKEFLIKDIAEIISGQSIYEAERTEGNTPYISSTANQNGIGYFVSNKNSTLEKNCLSVNSNGSVGYSFFHPYKALFSNDCRKLKPFYKSKYVGLFLSNQIMLQKEKYGYGYKMGTARLKKQNLLLPINIQKQPDYDYMESYIKDLKEKKEQKYFEYISKRFESLKNVKKPVSLSKKEWKEFLIKDIAEIISGQDIYEAERTEGITPYISSTANQNGIGYFVSNKNSTLEKNCLSVNRNGSVGYSFFHPYKALFSNDCRKLKPFYKSKYVGLFLSNQIRLQKEKYGYGYKMGTARLKKQKILLPTNSQNEPDYEYMERYMKYLEYQKLSAYLKFKK